MERKGFTVQATKYEQELPPLSKRKGARSDTMKKSTVTVNGVVYDADEMSMDRMNRIVSLANMEFNYRMSVGQASADAYQATYKDVKIPWVGADNVAHNVMVESIAEALTKSMENMGEVWSRYAK